MRRRTSGGRCGLFFDRRERESTIPVLQDADENQELENADGKKGEI